MRSKSKPPAASPLREIREAKGIRTVHVAAAANISVQQLNNLERGINRPNLATARALALALGVSVDDLFPPVEAELVGRAS